MEKTLFPQFGYEWDWVNFFVLMPILWPIFLMLVSPLIFDSIFWSTFLFPVLAIGLPILAGFFIWYDETEMNKLIIGSTDDDWVVWFMQRFLLIKAKILTYPIYFILYLFEVDFWSDANVEYLLIAYWFILIPTIPFGLMSYILFPLVVLSEIYVYALKDYWTTWGFH